MNRFEILQLEKRLPETSGEERMEILKKLAKVYCDSISEIAMGYNAQYLKLAQMTGSLIDQENAYDIFASIYKYQLDYEQSLKSNKEALKISIERNNQFKSAYHRKRTGDTFMFLHQFDSAFSYTRQALDYYLSAADTARILRCRIQLGKIQTASSQLDEAIRTFQDIIIDLSTVEIQNKTYILGWTYYWLAQAEMQKGDLINAIKHLKESIAFYKVIKYVYSMLGSMQTLGDLYLKTGDYAGAYELFFESIKNVDYVKGSIGKIHFKAQHFYNMGRIYLNIGNFDLARQQFDTAMNLALKYKFEHLLSKVYKGIGKNYFKQEKYDLALTYFEKAGEYYEERQINYGKVNIMYHTGKVYLMKKDYDEAIRIFSQAVEINKRIDNTFGLARNLNSLAVCYIKRHKYKKALELLDEGIDEALECGVDILLIEYYENYISLCDRTGQHNSAHHYFDKYMSLSSKISGCAIKNMSELMLNMHQNDVSATTQLLKQQIDIHNLEYEKQELKIRQILILSALVITLLILFLVLYFNKLRTNIKLEKTVQERTRSLKENEEKLIESNQNQDRFYSIIAHDLKSPFNSLIGFSNLLDEDFDEFSREEQKKYVSIIHNSAEEIFELLENLLEWTRSNSADFQIKPVKTDLSRITRQTLALLEKNAADKNIRITNDVHKNTIACVDENMVRTVIRNLASNAIKFTNNHGEIKLFALQEDTMLRYSVQDNGVGMAPEQLDKLFTSGKRIRKKGTAREKGSGLGLVLCSDFIRKCGGEITVSSELGKGSTFSFTLPLRKNNLDA